MIDDHQLQERLQQYQTDLERSVKGARLRLLNHLREWYGQQPDQEMIRRMSWTHSMLWENQEGYARQCRQALHALQLPVPAGKSRQDSYHHSHFVNACLLSLMCNAHSVRILEQPYDMTLNTCTIYEGEQEVERLEYLEMLYHTLSDLLPHREVQIESTTGQQQQQQQQCQADKDTTNFVLEKLRSIESTLARIEEVITGAAEDD